MTPLPPICPGCDSHNLHLYDMRHPPNFIWICCHCQTWIHMDKHELIRLYSMNIHYNNKEYKAYFYPYPMNGEPHFSLHCLKPHPQGEQMQILLELDFLPIINAKNFLDKLKT